MTHYNEKATSKKSTPHVGGLEQIEIIQKHRKVISSKRNSMVHELAKITRENVKQVSHIELITCFRRLGLSSLLRTMSTMQLCGQKSMAIIQWLTPRSLFASHRQGGSSTTTCGMSGIRLEYIWKTCGMNLRISDLRRLVSFRRASEQPLEI